MPRDLSSRLSTSTRPEVVVIALSPRASYLVSLHDTCGRAGGDTARDACPGLERRSIVASNAGSPPATQGRGGDHASDRHFDEHPARIERAGPAPGAGPLQRAGFPQPRRRLLPGDRRAASGYPSPAGLRRAFPACRLARACLGAAPRRPWPPTPELYRGDLARVRLERCLR